MVDNAMKYQLFPIGKVWHVRWTLDGKRAQRSTRETSRRRAELVAQRVYRDAQLWARGQTVVPTLREAVAQWLAAHMPIASRAHVKVVETFGRLHLYDLADLPLDELATAVVESARNRHRLTHAPSSTNQWLKTLRLICNWAVKRGGIPAIPFSVKTVKVQKRPRAMLPVSLTRQWLAALDEHEGNRRGVRTAARLMLGIGLREVETITARWEWIDWERQTYTPGVTKGREADPLPVPPWLLEYLRPHRRSSGLIVAKRGGAPFRSGFTRRAMLHANEAVDAGHITAHRLRGTFATLLSENGVPVQTIQRAMRHKSPMTTMGYLEADLQSVARAQAHIACQFGFTAAARSGNPLANSTPQTVVA
ncbi:tyrosine-type recombinase/integrase [Burkholderia anthina]|uniref:tyrosine-type recombinase/integrase n=1 Tax=Burkholderia anthina TaxID=179879 RepID=UPI001FC838E6|nr:site-specific integrase [Burkholderia anthina]